jgi:hypothetical protein
MASVSTIRPFCEMGKNRPLWVELSYMYMGFYTEFYGAFSDENFFLNTKLMMDTLAMASLQSKNNS